MRFMGRGQDGKIERLRASRLFDKLPRRQLSVIASNMDEVNVPAGETLIREGQHNDAFWVILDGQIELVIGGNHHTLGPGDFIGATSMLDGRAAIGTATTSTPVEALVASAAQFRALEGNETIALRLMSAALERMREDLEAQLGRDGG
jgi:CRP-like cAMP-binding protein